ncbi:MAG: hypothetical protein HZA53_06305 [Planctomycetes bacterium]|nr:hypothetical protein [Planctomycetota bacterium]
MALLAPGRSPFLLHGTLPLPDGARIEDLRGTLFVRSHGPGRALVPAQVEVVSRAPDNDADVVELLALVELAQDEQRGAPVAFEVVLGPRVELRAYERSAVVDALLRAPADEQLRTSIERDTDREVFRLRAHGLEGRTYSMSLRESPTAPRGRDDREVGSGPYRRVRRLHGAPCNGGGGGSGAGDGVTESIRRAFVHLMGMHAYVTEQSADDLVRLDLRLHNGMTSGRASQELGERPVGAIYWRDVELVVPKGWTAIPEVKDPSWGEPYDEGPNRVFPIVKPLPEGRMHLMGPQAQFERRLVLAPLDASGEGLNAKLAKAELAHEGLAFCQRGDGLWSWWNPDTARYFAARDLLASFDGVRRANLSGKAALRARHEGELRDLVEALSTGTAKGWYVTSGVMGWAHPWFVKEAGGVGGEGIATLEGQAVAYAASAAGYRYLELLHRMNVCRQPEAMYDARGDPVGYHARLDAEGRIPFDFRTNGNVIAPEFKLPCKWGPPASDAVKWVVEHGLRPPYDQGNWYAKDGSVLDSPANLLAWWPHDDQHMVRYTKNTKALVWLGNDAMAKDDLLLSAELYRLMRHESPHVPVDWSPGVTLAVWEKIVAEHPHQGLWFGREDGWGIDAMCAAYSTATPEWRARNRAWFDRMSKLLLDAAQPSGLLQRMVNERLLDPKKYTVAQTFECFFLMHALRCMNASVYRGVDEARRAELEALLVKGVEYLFFGPPWQRIQNDWQPDPAHPTLYLSGPRQGIAIAPNDDYASPPFSDVKRWGARYLPADGLCGGVEIFHPWQALAYASDATQGSAGKGLENRYLKRALDCWTGHASFATLLADLEQQASDPSQDNSSNWTGLAGRLQALGVR